MSFNTPILFIVFNRPRLTKETFSVIKRIKPKKLYISADGPRCENDNDAKLCKEVQAIFGEINWDCSLYTLINKENLGPIKSPINSLNWFFSNEKEGIIIEDDCKPSLSFFSYCESLLEKYRDDNRIFSIGGNNFQNGILRGDGDYYYSIYSHIWGWATWSEVMAEA